MWICCKVKEQTSPAEGPVNRIGKNMYEQT